MGGTAMPLLNRWAVRRLSGRALYTIPICGQCLRYVLPARLPVCLICLHSPYCDASHFIHIWILQRSSGRQEVPTKRMVMCRVSE